MKYNITLLLAAGAFFLLVLHGETIFSPLSAPQIRKGPFYFRCLECHSYLPPDFRDRDLEAEHLNVQLSHGEQRCYDCHQSGLPYELTNTEGARFSWERGNEHCGGCHEDVFKDWQFGAHGRRSGFWRDGERRGLNCVECHNAHNPGFPPRKPQAPPASLFKGLVLPGKKSGK